MTRKVVFAPQAQQHLTDLYEWIVAASGFADRAEAFVTEIIDYCEGLADFPMRGMARDDLRPG